jgi:hypothetical protein
MADRPTAYFRLMVFGYARVLPADGHSVGRSTRLSMPTRLARISMLSHMPDGPLGKGAATIR